jgi:hypothetical protein
LRIARESENAAKKPKREASALVLLIREFIKNVHPRIDKLGRLYSIPSGASGRSAEKQAAVRSYLEAFIAKHEKDANFTVIRDGKCVGVLPPCPHCVTNAHVTVKELYGAKGDQGLRMTVETNGDRHPVMLRLGCVVTKNALARRSRVIIGPPFSTRNLHTHSQH